MLDSADYIEVAGEAGTPHDALAAAQAQHHDVALVDIYLPDKNRLELIKRLRLQGSRTAVVVLSAYPEEMYALRALKKGAAVIIAAVRRAAAGGKYVSLKSWNDLPACSAPRPCAARTNRRTANWRC